jgi:hypothetical protein
MKKLATKRPSSPVTTTLSLSVEMVRDIVGGTLNKTEQTSKR